MKRTFQHIILIVLTVSCHQPNQENKLIGKWAGYESDSTYIEMWVNDSLLLTWNEEAWSYEVLPYDYDSQKDELKVFEDHGQTIKYKLHVDLKKPNSLILTNESGKWNFKMISSHNPVFKMNEQDTWEEIGKRNKKARH